MVLHTFAAAIIGFSFVFFAWCTPQLSKLRDRVGRLEQCEKDLETKQASLMEEKQQLYNDLQRVSSTFCVVQLAAMSWIVAQCNQENIKPRGFVFS